jgi:hypothetical protein
MSTVGTLYDETIKFGHGRLTNSTTISGVVGSVGFSLPADHDAFLFDLINLRPVTDLQALRAYVSMDNGASWKTDASYFWTFFSAVSHTSSPAGYVAGAAQTSFQLSAGVLNVSNLSGEFWYHRGAGFVPPFSWHTSCHTTSGYGQDTVRGAGTYWVGGLINAILFAFGSGSIAATGRINLYSFRKGT